MIQSILVPVLYSHLDEHGPRTIIYCETLKPPKQGGLCVEEKLYIEIYRSNNYDTRYHAPPLDHQDRVLGHAMHDSCLVCHVVVERSPTEWGDPTSKNCFGQTVPVIGPNYSGAVYPGQMQVLQGVLRAMQSPAYLLDITTLSELRKDGHPSIYSGDLSPEQRANPDRSADCSHWCLPGLPDTWNQLFYTALFF